MYITLVSFFNAVIYWYEYLSVTNCENNQTINNLTDKIVHGLIKLWEISNIQNALVISYLYRAIVEHKTACVIYSLFKNCFNKYLTYSLLPTTPTLLSSPSSRTRVLNSPSLHTGATGICPASLLASPSERTLFSMAQRAHVMDYKTNHLKAEYSYIRRSLGCLKKWFILAIGILTLINVVIFIHLLSRHSVREIISAPDVNHILDDETSALLNNTSRNFPIDLNRKIKKNLFPPQITLWKKPVVQTSHLQTHSSTPIFRDKQKALKHITQTTKSDKCTTTTSVLSRRIAEGFVLLRPALVGRLGNQLFSWSAVWGLSKQLQAALGGNISVRPVIWREAELYRLFGDHLDAVVTDNNELRCYKWEGIGESNPLFDASILERIVQRVRNGIRGVFSIGLYTQSWRYFHSMSQSNAIDSFHIYRQFVFPSPTYKMGNELIVSLKRDVELRYKNQMESPATSIRVQLQFNQTTIVTINASIAPIKALMYVAVHLRLTDHHKAQNSRVPNREFFVLAAAAFFAISQKVIIVL